MTTPEPRATGTTEQHLRALVVQMRKNEAAMASLAEALKGLVNVILSDQNAPADAEEAVPKAPKYLHPDDN